MQTDQSLKKIISFSLYGSHPVYTYGAIENAILAKELYPGWICRFYYNDTVPEKIITALKSLNCELVLMKTHKGSANMSWRFIPLFESDVDIVIIRDSDSRLNIREVDAVKEWLLSDKNFHIMRDHYWHGVIILGGMFGCRNKILTELKSSFESFDFANQTTVDQQFLAKDIYPFVTKLNTIYSHDERFNYEADKHNFPSNPQHEPLSIEHKYEGYVGEVIENVDIACKYLNEELIIIQSEDNTTRRDMTEKNDAT